MTGKQGKEDRMIRDERGAVRTLQRAWHTNEHEAAILYDTFFRAAAAVYG
jgi:hypothetical protein